MSLSKSSVILLAILILVTASVTLTSPVVAQDGIDSSNLEIGDISVPSEVELGDKIEITSSAAIPSLPADWSAQLEFVAYADDRQVGTQKVSIEDGDTADVSVSHSFQQAGSKELYFDVTGELTREGAVTEQSATIDRTTQAVTIDVTPEQVTTEGAAFTAPESIQGDIDDVRGEIPEVIRDETNVESSSHAFVLTSANESFVVFTNEDPKEGHASVEGFSPSNVVETDEFDFGVVVASDVEFKSPTEVSVGEVNEDAEDHDRKYVKINAHHRNIAINYEGGSSTTTGVLVADPLVASQNRLDFTSSGLN
ncbi:hypothetical protein [Halorubrum sp. FL23]|uniref:hypothetical protein n=1 Tax=Halorubrum sp. FL23 TaxID=3458704 RepID=UPI0040339DC6